jgi:cation transport regulator
MSENKELTEETTTAENAAPSPQETTSQATSQNQQILPEEIKGENLPSEAQQVYTAALKAAKSDGISEEGARQIAWNSVREMFEKGPDGKWYAKGEVTAQHYKAVTSGGN